MHKIVRLIVYAKTKEEALNNAKKLLDERLVPRPYDYGTFFDEEDSVMSGKARWGNLVPVAKADSPEGADLIKDGIEFTKDEFTGNLDRVREMINKYSNEELWKQEVLDPNKKMLEVIENENERKGVSFNLHMFRYFCHCIGTYEDGWLYDHQGELIHDDDHLKHTLEKWQNCEGVKTDEYKDLEVYVVPVDVHH